MLGDGIVHAQVEVSGMAGEGGALCRSGRGLGSPRRASLLADAVVLIAAVAVGYAARPPLLPAVGHPGVGLRARALCKGHARYRPCTPARTFRYRSSVSTDPCTSVLTFKHCSGVFTQNETV